MTTPPRPARLRRLRRLVRACTDGRFLERLSFMWRAWQAMRAIRAAGIFDPVWYARDGSVQGTPRQLVWHYVRRGAAEGRSPSPAFDTVAYLRAYPQVGFAASNPLHHYIEHGRKAGLAAFPAPPGRLARQALSPRSYQAWRAEMESLDARAADRLRAASATLPLIALAGDGPLVALAGDGDLVALAGDGDAQARHILLLPPGVTMASHAWLHLRQAVAEAPDAEFFYADEDHPGPPGMPAAAWFKPDWDPDLFLAGDLTGPATVMARQMLARLGWDGSVPDAASLRALSRRAVAAGCRPRHIPKILFHRPEPPRLAQIAWPHPEPKPLVSVIIPTRDRAGLLRAAALGVLEHTAYGPLELIILDNGSRAAATRRLLRKLARDARVRVVPAPGAFNWSALNNAGARLARGEIFVFLNNDVEIVSPDWLGALSAQAMRADVGAVGARLLYPDGTIQHAGLTLDGYGCFSHVFRGAPADDPQAGIARSVAAVTGACLAVRRDVFWSVGGLEENVLKVTCNDIDFCLRVRAAGYRVVYTPAAVLMHREAASRGHDMSRAQFCRVLAERDYLRRRWGGLATADPYLNPNLCLLDDRPALEAPARLVVEKGQGLCPWTPLGGDPPDPRS